MAPKQQVCFLTVTFSGPGGKAAELRVEVPDSPYWYTGMAMLLHYHQHGQELEIISLQTYWQAYAKAFMLLLTAIVLIVIGSLFL